MAQPSAPTARRPDAYDVTTIRLPSKLSEKLRRRLPRHGDRSAFFRGVVEMYLEGKLPPVVVIQPTKRF